MLVEGTTYQYDRQKMITRNIDRNGNTAEYRYDPDKNLREIKISGKDGWTATGQRDDKGSEWIVTDPRGNRAQYRYGNSGLLEEIKLPEGKSVTLEYGQNRIVANTRHQGYTEIFSFDADGYIREYKVQRTASSPMEVPKTEELYFTYDDQKNLTEIISPGLVQLDISYSENGLPLRVRTSRDEIHFSYNARGQISSISFSNGPSITYSYEGEALRKVEVTHENKHAEYTYGKDGIIRSQNLLGGTVDYAYAHGALSSVTVDGSGQVRYIHDSQNRLREIRFPNGKRIEYRYQRRKIQGKKEESFQGQAVTVITHASSPIQESEDIIFVRQIEEIKEAAKALNNGVVMDVFKGSKNTVQANIADSEGNLHPVDSRAAEELEYLLEKTANAKGKLGERFVERWDKFSHAHLAPLAKPTYWKSPDGTEVKLKPPLIIRSDEATFKYANLEKVPALMDNFIVFIDLKNMETSTMELARKINSIPSITKNNTVFALRLPDMEKHTELEQKWKEKMAELEEIVGKENVFHDPSKEEFSKMLSNQAKDIIVIELTHTGDGIILKGSEVYTSKDLEKLDDLSHIKYLMSGLGTCKLPQLEDGRFVTTLREKGVNVINATYGKGSTKEALQGIEILIQLFPSLEGANIRAYHLIDIIHQILRQILGTINLGKRIDDRNDHKNRLLG